MKNRLLVPELMDDPQLPKDEHRKALAGLRRINRLSGTGYQIAKAIRQIAKERSLTSISVLDIGCGSGDVTCSVAERLSKHLPCRVHGWDFSETAVDSATTLWNQRKEKSRHKQLIEQTDVKFEHVDVFNVPSVQFDFVYCCLFLHHFDTDQAIQVLKNMTSIAREAILVDDLHRTRLGLSLAYLACYGLSRSHVVHFDGPQSVRAAFKVTELNEIARKANLPDVSFQKHWPERFMMVSKKS